MPYASRRHRALRAGLGLAVVLTVGFAADALVLMTTRAHADAASAPPTPDKDRRISFVPSLTRSVRPGGSDAWTMAMVGLTLLLAVCGGLIAAGRRFLPPGAGAGMQVVGRVSLSPRHTVYMLRVDKRVLVVGVGPQGAPSLITELDEPVESDRAPDQGEQT